MSSTDTGRTDALDYAETIAAEVIGLADGELDGYTFDGEDPDRAYEATMAWLDELALDVEVTRSVTTGDVTAVTVCRTIGGPNAWVTFDAYGDAEVRTAWGRDEARVPIPGRMIAIPTDVILDYYAEVIA
jgi:hypothetical protein